LKLAQGASFTV